jgi:RNA polymerase sigma factor (sigma-70 family)
MRAPIFSFDPGFADARMLERLRKGEEEALAELYEQNRTLVLSYVTRNGGTTDDSEDLLQEAVIVLWERVRAEKFEPTAKLSTFLYSIVKHKWSRRAEQLRRNVRQSEETFEISDGDAIADELLIDAEQKAAIVNAMDKLDDPCKRLLLLFYWEERTTDEIARMMGFANADTVKSKKYQCKKSLEKLLKELL